MFTDQPILRIPGPTPIPPSVRQAMSQPMIGHRTQETTELLTQVRPKLKPVFGTDQEVVILTGSGTAGLEAAVVNTVKPGEDVLVIVTGAFGDRFAKICDAYQINTQRFDVKWGEAVNPEDIAAYLKKNTSIKAVFATHCETSTGILNPIKELAKVVHDNSDALFIVDGVSSIGGVETKMDEWNIDLLVTGSQKALMLPPGLTFLAASDRAWKVMENNGNSRFYLNLQKYRDSQQKNAVPYTPALTLMFGLEEALKLIEEEDLQHIFNRHHLLRDMTRAAFKAHDIPLLTVDEFASPTVTAIRPTDFNPEELRKTIKSEFNLDVAGGQKQLKEKIFRIGHMGYCTPADILETVSMVEIGLRKIGKEIELGAGVRAAQEIYLK
ncbi:pyridoxal-phosphate-dependent aminotransferase family protein [Virgibacillus kekensis]|uniref:Pyridoxal-phosphate-dependent aminotransferase family protein n=1 Tax=Virgibacillus kekensis TaxID=202261 RepID=A0ABV9DJQ6_9BACI